ncbi:MAG: glycosidase [Phycisphaerae bacterium]|nr:glycosidase [Phycisphaerae bacterium]MDD5380444.1 glycosidase [Phycisphaerae bacterium]
MSKNSTHELFQRHPDNPILSVEDWPYKANSVFNAAAAEIDGKTVLLARVEDFRGISHLTTAISDDGIGNWRVHNEPALKPEPKEHPEELWGIEDPRITWIEEMNKWAICYTAYSKGGPLVSLAMTADFKSFERIGPVMPPEDKDAALFPVKFNGLWAMLHRPVAKSPLLGAHIWISFSPNLKHWGEHKEIIHAREGGWWDAGKIGLCAPPMQTKEGWLLLYHGVRTTASGSIYRLGLALLDLQNPTQVIRRTDEWIFGPKAHYEREGDVDDVVFPCGWIKRGNKIFMYYGAADSRICLATAEFDEVVEVILKCPSGDYTD